MRATVTRPAGPDDLPAVLRLYAQLHPTDLPLDVDVARSTYAAALATQGLSFWLLEVDGVVVGTTYLNVIPNLTRGAAPYAVIENVVVEESLRGTGLGRRLMAATLEAAWAAGCYKAMLMTGSSDPATHGFYRACGFSGSAKTAYLARRP